MDLKEKEIKRIKDYIDKYSEEFSTYGITYEVAIKRLEGYYRYSFDEWQLGQLNYLSWALSEIINSIKKDKPQSLHPAIQILIKNKE